MEINIPSLLRIKPGALQKLGKYLRYEKFSSVAVFWGIGVEKLFAQTVGISLNSSDITILQNEEIDSHDIDDVFAAAKNLPSNCDAIVAIGGGTVIDFCKYLSLVTQIPVFAVPTLISNDAFASPISSLNINGRRKSVKSSVPNAVIIDTEIITSAPLKYIYSGMGDLFSKTTAIYDWKLSYDKRRNTVNDFAATVSQNAADTFSYFNNKDLDDPEYVKIIASSLLMTGIAMIIAGNSRPASGSEHLISHAYDSLARKPSLHGLQVGVASYAVSFVQESTHQRVTKDLLESGFFEFVKTEPLSKADFIQAVRKAPEIKENFYTILSENERIDRLIEFVESDNLMQQMVV